MRGQAFRQIVNGRIRVIYQCREMRLVRIAFDTKMNGLCNATVVDFSEQSAPLLRTQKRWLTADRRLCGDSKRCSCHCDQKNRYDA